MVKYTRPPHSVEHSFFKPNFLGKKSKNPQNESSHALQIGSEKMSDLARGKGGGDVKNT